MSYVKKLSVLSFSLALVLVLGACAGQLPAAPAAAPAETQQEAPEETAAEAAMAEEEMEQDIVAIAAGDERFSTLVTALTEAGLVETLQGDGPFTVFAPTNDAFAALPEGALEGFLADIPALTDVLLYHVVAGEVMAADVVNLDMADTVQGTAVDITVEDGKVMVNEAEVIITDIQASNGVIHVIDAVLVPAQ